MTWRSNAFLMALRHHPVAIGFQLSFIAVVLLIPFNIVISGILLGLTLVSTLWTTDGTAAKIAAGVVFYTSLTFFLIANVYKMDRVVPSVSEKKYQEIGEYALLKENRDLILHLIDSNNRMILKTFTITNDEALDLAGGDKFLIETYTEVTWWNEYGSRTENIVRAADVNKTTGS